MDSCLKQVQSARCLAIHPIGQGSALATHFDGGCLPALALLEPLGRGLGARAIAGRMAPTVVVGQLIECPIAGSAPQPHHPRRQFALEGGYLLKAAIGQHEEPLGSASGAVQLLA